MRYEQAPEEIERLLGAFIPIGPSNAAEARIAAATWRCRRNRRVAWWAGGIAAAAAAGACFVFSAWISGARPSAPAPAAVASPAPATEDLGIMKAELAAIREMCDVIPVEKRDMREEIDAKLNACLQRLESLEKSLGSGRESSWRPLAEHVVVNV
ncbi:MAG TPA: hypothetical protein PKX48_02325 [Planctomycetota bacterium]|jgi:hypothetical protein|nr:hypothetical protein [Planctomycetota bacterium]OQC21526.1 MAG: hypothetical protein BWX69_00734 [Planctomycetes bacterium ADurb.Bin069]HNS00231.1 hypothetical protein [Planctomycetota bacterium]HNU26152.1 hypothetical protein [Planctomycetota bacterium]HOE28831.1 hypothetical protein [Planctomycetota bacterium]